jgi:hypothetical protein
MKCSMVTTPIVQTKWGGVAAEKCYDWLPERFGDVLAFAGPALTGHVDGQSWDPQAARWDDGTSRSAVPSRS